MRNSSARASTAGFISSRSESSLSPTITRISATFPIGLLSLLAIPRFRGGGPAVALSLTQIKRRKRALLMQFEMSFANQFERGGKSRRQHGSALRRIGEILDQILVERTPIHRLADEPLQRLARFRQRPDGAQRQ